MGLLFSFVKDVVVVTLSVFIALLVDRWRERRSEETFLRKVIDTVLNEAKEIRDSLPALIDEHVGIAEALSESARKGEDLTIGKIVSSGIPLNLTRGSMALSLFTGKRAQIVEYDLLKLLWDINTLNAYVDRISERVSDHLMMKWNSDAPEDKLTLANLLYTLVEAESMLVNLYDRLTSMVG